MIISGGIFEKNEVKKKLDLISKETSKENFWKDQKKVKNILKEKKFFDFLISSYQNLVKDIKNIEDLHSLGNEEQNEEIIKDCNLKIEEIYNDVKKLEVSCFLSGENDSLDIYLEVHAGVRGEEERERMA